MSIRIGIQKRKHFVWKKTSYSKRNVFHHSIYNLLMTILKIALYAKVQSEKVLNCIWKTNNMTYHKHLRIEVIILWLSVDFNFRKELLREFLIGFYISFYMFKRNIFCLFAINTGKWIKLIFVCMKKSNSQEITLNWSLIVYHCNQTVSRSYLINCNYLQLSHSTAIDWIWIF